MSLLVKSHILGLSLNTLTANGKYSPRKIENLRQPIQMQLYKNQKTFSRFFPPFLKSTTNLEHLETKYGPDSLCVYETTDCERRS